MAKIIAIMNEKGGVGKTATATALAYLLAKSGKKTTLMYCIDWYGIMFLVLRATNWKLFIHLRIVESA